MLAPYYLHLKERLLALPGMSAAPFQTKSGPGPAGSMEQFQLAGRPFVTLRLTPKFIMVYASELLDLPGVAEQVTPALQAQYSGKTCFKITTPDKVEVAEVEALFAAAARQWPA